jgi:hypothetical protein
MILKSRTAQQLLGIVDNELNASPEEAQGVPVRRKRRSPAEEGVAAAHRVFGQVLEKADPKATAKRR